MAASWRERKENFGILLQTLREHEKAKGWKRVSYARGAFLSSNRHICEKGKIVKLSNEPLNNLLKVEKQENIHREVRKVKKHNGQKNRQKQRDNLIRDFMM